jgi:putative acetyltransferase
MSEAARLVIRAEQPRDWRAVFEVHARAFPQLGEAKLVEALRAAGAATISLVAERDGRVVGHILFSPVRVAGGGGGGFAAQGLAPMAVDPGCQREGIGSALVRAGLDACRDAGHTIVFVLGHPDYYPRFGFEAAAPRGLHSQGGAAYAPAFFVAELAAGSLAGRAGVVQYRPEFAALSLSTACWQTLTQARQRLGHLARGQGATEGFRTIINTGRVGNQEVEIGRDAILAEVEGDPRATAEPAPTPA